MTDFKPHLIRWIDPVPGMRTFSAVLADEKRVREDGRVELLATYETFTQALNAADVIQKVFEESEKGRKI